VREKVHSDFLRGCFYIKADRGEDVRPPVVGATAGKYFRGLEADDAARVEGKAPGRTSAAATSPPPLAKQP